MQRAAHRDGLTRRAEYARGRRNRRYRERLDTRETPPIGEALIRRTQALARAPGALHCLLARVANRLDIVAVRITDEGAVVAGVVLGPLPRRMENRGARVNRYLEEGAHRHTIGRGEGDVRLTEPLPRASRADPEVNLRLDTEADHLAEVQEAATTEWGENPIVERRACRDVGALYRDVVEHPDMFIDDGPTVNDRGRRCAFAVAVTVCARVL